MFLAVALLNLMQTDLAQWAPRPSIECDNGDAVHRYVEVNATRVNIRDLPTVFSNVLSQKNAPDQLTVVCEFGVWSRIDLLDVGPETWISTGLITLRPEQPITGRMKSVYLGLLIMGALGLLIAKGSEELAFEIIEEAKKHGIFIAEDPQLVSALSQVGLSEEIPEELYHAVAVMLSWAYWMKGLKPEN